MQIISFSLSLTTLKLLCFLHLILILLFLLSSWLIIIQTNDSLKKRMIFFFVLSLFQIAYKSDYKHDGVDYNYPATLTPSYQTTRKLVPLKDVNNFMAFLHGLHGSSSLCRRDSDRLCMSNDDLIMEEDSWWLKKKEKVKAKMQGVTRAERNSGATSCHLLQLNTVGKN